MDWHPLHRKNRTGAFIGIKGCFFGKGVLIGMRVLICSTGVLIRIGMLIYI